MARNFVSSGLLVLGLLGFGCATQSQRAMHLKCAQALEAAFRHAFDKFDKYPYQGVYVIEAGEFTPWLVSQFRGHRPEVVQAVVGMTPAKTGGGWINWSATVQIMGDHEARIYVRFSYWPGPSGGGYILNLHPEKRRWLVDSEDWSQTGS